MEDNGGVGNGCSVGGGGTVDGRSTDDDDLTCLGNSLSDLGEFSTVNESGNGRDGRGSAGRGVRGRDRGRDHSRRRGGVGLGRGGLSRRAGGLNGAGDYRRGAGGRRPSAGAADSGFGRGRGGLDGGIDGSGLKVDEMSISERVKEVLIDTRTLFELT